MGEIFLVYLRNDLYDEENRSFYIYEIDTNN